jgi:hypothetical protein
MNKIIKIALYIVGFVLALFDVIYTIILSMVNLLPENSYKVVLVAIVAISLLLIASRISSD